MRRGEKDRGYLSTRGRERLSPAEADLEGSPIEKDIKGAREYIAIYSQKWSSDGKKGRRERGFRGGPIGERN